MNSAVKPEIPAGNAPVGLPLISPSIAAPVPDGLPYLEALCIHVRGKIIKATCISINRC
ncbi:hypothetical protein [Bartonella sp. OT172YNZD]|uniref:hypothetical protein n=1 Tax=Bartonella sp. OT172YNZD TaxID=3243572 RepID=UPI0035D0A728